MNKHTSIDTPGHCLLCNTATFKVIHQKQKWQYRQCKNCGLVSISPIPDLQALKETYRNYLPKSRDDITAWIRMMTPFNRATARIIEKNALTEKGKILDIGCGYGSFLKEMQQRKWQIEGIEVSKTGRKHAREKFGIELFDKSLEDLALPDAAYDVVTLIYVIEHILDPSEMLKEVKRILKPGGLLLLRWPHTTPIVKLLGQLANRLDLYHTPYHLYDFSPSTIKKLTGVCGFENIKTMPGGHTHPPALFNRMSAITFGYLDTFIYTLTAGNLLIPGTSKTTIAFKPA